MGVHLPPHCLNDIIILGGEIVQAFERASHVVVGEEMVEISQSFKGYVVKNTVSVSSFNAVIVELFLKTVSRVDVVILVFQIHHTF